MCKLPENCVFCKTRAVGKDLNIFDEAGSGHMFQWIKEPELFVVICKECWQKVCQAVDNVRKRVSG